MKLNNLDLNLLVVFNAIYTEGSLTKAGEIVGITQPAVSSALSKLRDYFNDQLFIRVGQGVQPTAKTENIIIHVREALLILHKTLEEPDAFDPAVSKTKLSFFTYMTKGRDDNCNANIIGQFMYLCEEHKNVEWRTNPARPQSGGVITLF